AGGEPDERTALERMLEARSVAVVGASVKEGSLGRQMMLELIRGGFEGAVYPVNPSYDEVLGRRCYPSIADVPEAVDLAILGVANQRIEQALSDAVAAGARSAVTFSSLYEAEPPRPGLPLLAERVATIARDAGIAVCGGNGMGFLNLEANLRATGFATPDHIRRGHVAFISHSGSAFAALSFNDRGIGFNVIVSSGQELVTDVADYMEHALGLASTRVIALLIETVRRPGAFRAALAHAMYRDIPVIALKVGRTERSKSMVTAHSGALAGEDGAFEALFEAYGVLRVATLDEMADAMELFSSPRRITTGSGIASIHDSGGERALLVDVAADLGVPFARISDATTERIQAALDPGLEAANPLDAWGTGIDADRIFVECFLALHDDPETAALAFVADMTRQGEPHDEGYLHVAREVLASTTKPFCILSNLASAVANDEAALLRDGGIPVLEGTASGLTALRHLLAYRDGRARSPVVAPEPVSDQVRERWRSRLASGVEVGELEGLALLADYGIPVTAARGAMSAAEAIAAAEEVGWPVALKTAASGVHHKSDVGGVALGLTNADALRAAYEDVASRLGPQVVVAAMAPPGVEVALGIVRDPQFGPLVLVAAGGVLVEILRDRRMALPPLDVPRSLAMIDRLRVRPLLDGVRGAPPADVDALARAISRLSVLAADLGEELAALDVNPVIVTTDGCMAVDALVVPRRP
ncbi:MAG: acetate--CoA ligase family protein, partial [Actinomycetota bacterium]